jgi:hypothetical protein
MKPAGALLDPLLELLLLLLLELLLELLELPPLQEPREVQGWPLPAPPLEVDGLLP